MSRKKVFVQSLSKTEKETLTAGWKHGKSHAFRTRCHCLLMSDNGLDAEQLSQLCNVTIGSIYAWIRNWEKKGIAGITTKPGQGRKPKLCIDNENHVKVVDKAVKNAVEKGTNILDDVTTELKIEGGLSKRTLNRFLVKKSTVTSDCATSLKRNPTE